MSNILIINAAHEYSFAPGRLNASLVEIAEQELQALGHTTRSIKIDDDLESGWDVEAELAHHQWADVIILQTPVNWMMVPWSFKKYMDEIYTAGMGGALCNGDGRTRKDPSKIYGSGGTLEGKKYMFSLTLNAPADSFDDTAQFFEGKSIDDLFFPMHANMRFFALEPLPSFAAYDVMKNADVEGDFERYKAHLREVFGS